VGVGEDDFVFVVDGVYKITCGVCPGGDFAVWVGVGEWTVGVIVGSCAGVAAGVCYYGFCEWL
jgi:hypothetical protein